MASALQVIGAANLQRRRSQHMSTCASIIFDYLFYFSIIFLIFLLSSINLTFAQGTFPANSRWPMASHGLFPWHFFDRPGTNPNDFQ